MLLVDVNVLNVAVLSRSSSKHHSQVKPLRIPGDFRVSLRQSKKNRIVVIGDNSVPTRTVRYQIHKTQLGDLLGGYAGLGLVDGSVCEPLTRLALDVNWVSESRHAMGWHQHCGNLHSPRHLRVVRPKTHQNGCLLLSCYSAVGIAGAGTKT